MHVCQQEVTLRVNSHVEPQDTGVLHTPHAACALQQLLATLPKAHTQEKETATCEQSV